MASRVTVTRRSFACSPGSSLYSHQKIAVVHLLHERHARAGLDVLRGVLPRGEEHRGNDVCSVGVETTQGSRHRASYEVLLQVGLDHGLDEGQNKKKAE